MVLTYFSLEVLEDISIGNRKQKIGNIRNNFSNYINSSYTRFYAKRSQKA